MRFSHNFFVSEPIKLKFGKETQNWMLIHIADSKSGFGDDFGNMAQKPLFYVHFWRLFGQTLLGHNIAMATPKIPGNQKLFERVCYI